MIPRRDGGGDQDGATCGSARRAAARRSESTATTAARPAGAGEAGREGMGIVGLGAGWLTNDSPLGLIPGGARSAAMRAGARARRRRRRKVR